LVMSPRSLQKSWIRSQQENRSNKFPWTCDHGR
jgi:hypothetical protein